MIRHKPTYMVLNAFGVACTLFLILALPLQAWHHGFPLWLNEALYAALCAMFIYNIFKHVRGPIEPTPFVLAIGERNLWALKGTLLAVAIVLVAVVLEGRLVK